MAKINSAYETLIDPVRRMEYDASLNGGVVGDPEPDQRPSSQPEAVQYHLVHRLREHRTPIYGLAFKPDTGQLVSSSFDNELIWWNLDKGLGEKSAKLEGGVVSTIHTMSSDRLVAAGCSESVTSSWRLDGTQMTANRHTPTDWACCVSISPDGGKIAIGSIHNSLHVRRAFDSDECFQANKHTESITAVGWSTDGRFIATGSADATVRVWSANSGSELHAFQNVRSTVSSISFSPNGKFLAVAAVDLSIRVFDLGTLMLAKTLFGHERPIEQIAFHPNGWLLGSVGRDGRIGLWDVHSGMGHGKIEASHMPLSTIAFSPDGSTMAAGGLDKVLRIWDINVKS